MSSVNESRNSPIVPFNALARVEVLETESGRGRTRIGDCPELSNHLGTVHGGALFTVGDVASGGALHGALGERAAALFAVVKNATIHFLKPARGAIEASATLVTPIDQVLTAVERDGRTIAIVNVTLTNTEGVVVAEMDLEWYVAPRR